MSEAKIIKVSTNLPTEPDIFFNWFEANFVSGLSFGFEDVFFRMATGSMIPLREGNTLTIQIKHDLLSRLQGDFYVVPANPIYSTLRIKAIKSPHGGTDITAICETTYPEFEPFFGAIWKTIDRNGGELGVDNAKPEEPPKHPEPKNNGGKINQWLDWYHAMNENGYKCTLSDLARKSGYSLGYLKQKHMVYQAKPNQKT